MATVNFGWCGDPEVVWSGGRGCRKQRGWGRRLDSISDYKGPWMPGQGVLDVSCGQGGGPRGHFRRRTAAARPIVGKRMVPGGPIERIRANHSFFRAIPAPTVCSCPLHLYQFPLFKVISFTTFAAQTGRNGLMQGRVRLMGPQRTAFVHIINPSIFQRRCD